MALRQPLNPRLDLGQHRQHPRVGGGHAAQVLHERLPKGALESLADLGMHQLVVAHACLLIQPEVLVQQQLVSQLLVRHPPDLPRRRRGLLRLCCVPRHGCCLHRPRRRRASRPLSLLLGVVRLHRLLPRNLGELLAELLLLRLQLRADLPVLLLVLEPPLRLLEPPQCMSQPPGQLLLIQQLPLLEGPKVGAQQARELQGDVLADVVPRLALAEGDCCLVEALDHWLGCQQHLVLEVSDVFKHVVRPRGNHVSRKVDLDVDGARDEGLAPAPPVCELDDAMEHVLGCRNHLVFPKLGRQILKRGVDCLVECGAVLGKREREAPCAPRPDRLDVKLPDDALRDAALGPEGPPELCALVLQEGGLDDEEAVARLVAGLLDKLPNRHRLLALLQHPLVQLVGDDLRQPRTVGDLL
mmetsp:Transcript_23312/g.58438  ORF Transcript_23312/g.58438 Transcript_23312/m.58438 type:complete len:413 (-) Transcript_23312:846-2084(-)